MSSTKRADGIPLAKVGVFTPCFNMGKYIEEALDSLYAQTFNDFILIVADDASTSKSTLEKLSRIAHPRCQIYYEKKNLGLTKIANKYMAKLNAEYIMLFNSDDKLHPDFLKEQVDYLDSHPEVQAVSTWVQEFGDGRRLLKYDDTRCELPYMLVENNFSGAALMRKSAWLDAGKHDTNKDLYPNLDYDLWLSMLEKGFKLGIIPKPLFYWRVVRKSLSHSVNAKQMLIFRKALFKKYLPLYREYSDYVIGHYLDWIGKFEEYYSVTQEGHAWLEKQNEELTEENSLLRDRLARSIQRPYVRSLSYKVVRRLKRTLK